MTPIEEADIAMTLVCGVELVADETDDPALVCACKLVLTELLEYRIHLPQPRTSPENGDPTCSDVSSGSASKGPASS